MTADLLETIEKVISEKDRVLIQLANAKIIRKQITEIEEEIARIDMDIVKFKESFEESETQAQVKKGDKNNAKRPSCRGCGPLNPLPSCYKILKSYPHKKSGYYWVKPDCSSLAMRVYCEL